MLSRLRPGARRVASNTGWLIFDRVARIGVGVIVGAWFARYLGPGGFGLYNFVLAIVGITGVLATMGMDNIVVRDLARQPQDSNEILSAAFKLRLAGGALTIVASVGVVTALRPHEHFTQLLTFLVSASPLLASFDVTDFWFQARVASRNAVYARSVAFFISTGFRVLLIVNGAGLLLFVGADLVTAAMMTTAMVVAYQLSGQSVTAWKSSNDRVWKLLADSWPQALSNLAIFIYMRIDVIMLRMISGEEAVGVYSAGIRPSEVWYFVPMSLVSSVFPLIVAYRSVNQTLYYRRLQQLFAAMAAAALAIAIPMTFMSTWVIKLLYGAKYAAAGPILAVHVWAALFVFWGVAQEPWNVSEGLQKITLIRTLVGAAINVLLNFILLPKYNGFGAAIATVISYGFATIVGNAIIPKTRRIFWMQISSLAVPVHFKSELKSIFRSILPATIAQRLREMRDMVSDIYARPSYALEGEDMVLRRLMEGQASGFYVDVGAHHPKRFSNTYFFYRAGWNGINIDASTASMKDFGRLRPRDINVNAAVTKDGRELVFHHYSEAALNSFDPTFAAARAGELVSQERMATRRLEEILSQHLPAGQKIDFMSVDVEGMDLEVLQGNDWSKYRPTFLLVECFGTELGTLENSDPSVAFLAAQDYVPVAKTANTVVFRDKRSPRGAIDGHPTAGAESNASAVDPASGAGASA